MYSSNISTGVFFETENFDDKLVNLIKKDRTLRDTNYKIELRWRNIIYLIIFHYMALKGIYLAFTSAKIATNIFAFVIFEVAAMGITAGVHRLWAHRAYKATWQLRLLLVILNSMAMQGNILSWSRDHRVHHKYTDTNADPYSASRGFFFAHIGWLCISKHPDVIEKGKGIDMSDLQSDPILVFQKKYYWVLMPLLCFIIPSLIPVYFWNESLTNAIYIPGVLRVLVSLHSTFFVNSAAHFYGYKPYDRNISPVENLPVAIMSQGEGWHNYHHTFPWDYKASELGNYSLNISNAFIDFFAWIGWAYDLKSVNQDIIKKRIQRTGDGSHEIWGWGDRDITKEDEDATIIT